MPRPLRVCDPTNLASRWHAVATLTESNERTCSTTNRATWSAVSSLVSALFSWKQWRASADAAGVRVLIRRRARRFVMVQSGSQDAVSSEKVIFNSCDTEIAFCDSGEWQMNYH